MPARIKMEGINDATFSDDNLKSPNKLSEIARTLIGNVDKGLNGIGGVGMDGTKHSRENLIHINGVKLDELMEQKGFKPDMPEYKNIASMEIARACLEGKKLEVAQVIMGTRTKTDIAVTGFALDPKNRPQMSGWEKFCSLFGGAAEKRKEIAQFDAQMAKAKAAMDAMQAQESMGGLKQEAATTKPGTLGEDGAKVFKNVKQFQDAIIKGTLDVSIEGHQKSPENPQVDFNRFIKNFHNDFFTNVLPDKNQSLQKDVGQWARENTKILGVFAKNAPECSQQMRKTESPLADKAANTLDTLAFFSKKVLDGLNETEKTPNGAANILRSAFLLQNSKEDKSWPEPQRAGSLSYLCMQCGEACKKLENFEKLLKTPEMQEKLKNPTVIAEIFKAREEKTPLDKFMNPPEKEAIGPKR